MALYHKLLGFPAGAQAPAGRFGIQYSHHARTEAQKDRYDVIRLPSSIDLDGSETFELEVDRAGVPVKAAVRLRYSTSHDIILVLRPNGTGRVFCLTVWLNEHHDDHNTLKYGRYARP